MAAGFFFANHALYHSGMLEEFCAGTIDIRCRGISTSIGYRGNKFFEDYLQGYYSWDAAIGAYLSKLEGKYPAKYKELIEYAVIPLPLGMGAATGHMI